MKRAAARLLRSRTTWQLVAIATVCTALALAILYGVRASTLRRLKSLLVLLFAGGGAALILACVRRGEEIQRHGQAARMWTRLLAVVLAIAGLLAFVTYSFGHHRRAMIAGCNASLLPPTTAARGEALGAAEAALRSPFALLPRLLDDRAARECARSRADFERAAQGLCTRWPLVDSACACGDERYPYARCSEPRCLYDPGMPDRFDCPGDPILAGYPSF